MYRTSAATRELSATRKSVTYPSKGVSASHRPSRGPGALASRYGPSSARISGGYAKGTRWHRSSTKKSKGFTGRMSKAASTVNTSEVVLNPSGKVSRTTRFPQGSCCQRSSAPAGSTVRL
jgi:hypothetical protein